MTNTNTTDSNTDADMSNTSHFIEKQIKSVGLICVKVLFIYWFFEYLHIYEYDRSTNTRCHTSQSIRKQIKPAELILCLIYQHL